MLRAAAAAILGGGKAARIGPGGVVCDALRRILRACVRQGTDLGHREQARVNTEALEIIGATRRARAYTWTPLRVDSASSSSRVVTAARNAIFS